MKMLTKIVFVLALISYGSTSFAAANAAKSTVAVTGSPATADNFTTVTLTATIVEPNGTTPTPGETVTFVQPASVTLSSPTCITNIGGKCFVTATSSVAGDYSTVVSISDGDLNGSPATYTFTPGPVSLSTSTIEVSPATGVTADGTATSAITI
ncbi:MAG: Ig-like domain-containing protein, partial [Proteobacteria bacterium]|nr:Ig-like domain-containing protein [Pseudomonadota bacterium]